MYIPGNFWQAQFAAWGTLQNCLHFDSHRSLLKFLGRGQVGKFLIARRGVLWRVLAVRRLQSVRANTIPD